MNDPSNDAGDAAELETRPPAELTPDQQQEILDSIVEFRKQKKSSKRLVLHGWKLEWNVSKARGVERGDLTVYDPHTGGKINSLLALKRRFGLEPELPPPEPAAVEYEDAVTAEYEETKRKRALLDQAPELLERSKRSTRKEVCYVEMTNVAPPRSALVTLALKNKGGAGSDLDYVEICRAVHQLGDAVEPAVPFTAVRTAMLSMLRNGSLRRALADTARVPPNPPIEHALSMLVLSTLQVDEPSDAVRAPWRQLPPEAAAAEAAAAAEMRAVAEAWAAEKAEKAAAVERAAATAEAPAAQKPVAQESEAAAASEEAVDLGSTSSAAAAGAGIDAGVGEAPQAFPRVILKLSGGSALEEEVEEDDDEDEEDEEKEEKRGSWRGRRARDADYVYEDDDDGDGDDDDDYEYEDDEDEDEGRRRHAKRGQRGAYVGGGGGDSRRGRGRGEAADADAPLPPQMESLASLSHLKERLPISSLDPSAFSCPVGWVEERDDSGRRRKKKWVQYEAPPSDGRVLREFERRQELEATLEAEAESAAEADAAAGVELVSPPYLGNLVNGLEGPEWQISSHAAGRALRYILGRLVDRGLIATVTADEARGTRSTQPQWAVRNRYYRAEPWPRLKRERPGKEVEEEPEEELADIEIERKRNIARNQEILRQLGLA